MIAISRGQVHGAPQASLCDEKWLAGDGDAPGAIQAARIWRKPIVKVCSADPIGALERHPRICIHYAPGTNLQRIDADKIRRGAVAMALARGRKRIRANRCVLSHHERLVRDVDGARAGILAGIGRDVERDIRAARAAARRNRNPTIRIRENPIARARNAQ